MASRVVPGSPGAIVDMVCDVCRAEGFSVEKKPQPQNDSPSVDILASRKNGKKTQTLAFECWEGDDQVNGKQVEGFVKRINTLGLSGGVYVSPKGFTGDAEFVARKLGIELWDIATLKEHLARIRPPETSRVPGTLPVSRTVASKIFSNTLENSNALRIVSLPRLEFRPYIFAKFRVGSGKKSSVGVLVLDGVDGRVCDAGTLEGEIGSLPTSGLFVDCLDLQPLTGSMGQLSPELEMKNTVTVAPLGIASESIASRVTESLQNEARFFSNETATTEVNLLHVPILTVELATAGKSYRKIVQAATGKMIWDDTFKCSYCAHPSRAVCEECGGTVCEDHLRRCGSCGKHVCSDCASTKGKNKTPLCPVCKNR